MDVLAYAQSGGMERVTLPSAASRLDGFFLSAFEHADPKQRAQCLDRLYRDKSLMVQASLAFIVLFLSFLGDPDYYVRGIGEGGISAVA